MIRASIQEAEAFALEISEEVALTRGATNRVHVGFTVLADLYDADKGAGLSARELGILTELAIPLTVWNFGRTADRALVTVASIAANHGLENVRLLGVAEKVEGGDDEMTVGK